MPLWFRARKSDAKSDACVSEGSTVSSERLERKQPSLPSLEEDTEDGTSLKSSKDGSQTTVSTVATNRRRDVEEADSAWGDARFVMGDKTLALVQASLPMPVWTAKGRYSVQLRRASLMQAFGVTFNEQAGTITVAENLPHMGICKSDAVVMINRTTPRTLKECVEIMGNAMSVIIILQRSADEDLELAAVESHPCCSSPILLACGIVAPKPDRVCLSLTRAIITDEGRGEFRLSLHRASLSQRFGLSFTAEHPRGSNARPVIAIKEDMPHIGLDSGDRLVSINGVAPRSVSECCTILEKSMTVSLVLRRHPSRLGQLEPVLERPIEMKRAPRRGEVLDLREVPQVSMPRRNHACGIGCMDSE